MNDKVSIVIIGRNEERDIGRCVGAALAAAEQIGGAEIIYVDSASTDKTISVVQSFGVRVLALQPDAKLSPSAGRFVGSQYASGDFILFLDADTLIYKNFLPAALEHFRHHADVGGVNGFIDDLNEKGEVMIDVEERFDAATNVKWLRGPCCFYRAEAMRKAGSFNPHLAMEEEAELGLRLLKNGWRLNLIPLPMACHTRFYHGQTIKSLISTLKRDVVTKRLGEITKTIGYAFKEGNGLIFCWLRLKTAIVFLVWLFLLSLCLLLPETFYPGVVFFTLVLLGGLAIFRKKRSFSQTLLFIPSKLLIFIDILAGFHKISFKNTGGYSLDVVEYKSDENRIKSSQMRISS